MRFQKPATPKWFKWAFVIFLAWAVFSVFFDHTGPDAPDKPSLSSIKKNPEVRRWQNLIDPGRTRGIDIDEIRVGEGEEASCGHKVTLRVRSEQDKEIPDDQLTPVTFTVGSQEVIPAWERAVMGMRPGGLRAVRAGAMLVNPSDTGEGEPVEYEIELISLSPIPPADEPRPMALIRRAGKGLSIGCGEEMLLHLVWWDETGKKRIDTHGGEPLSIRLGHNQIAHGIDRAALGMMENEVREVLIPPSHLGRNETLELPAALKNIPRHKIAVVEIERVVYVQPKPPAQPAETEE